MSRPIRSSRFGLFLCLLALAFVTIGSGTCVVVEEGPPGAFEGPGENEEAMEEQEIEIIDESNR
jgi:hypothetical protein